MEQQGVFHIIVIDDNPDIHNDFLKILKPEQSNQALDKLDQEIFGQSKPTALLPSYEIDTALQGQEGVERIKQALESGVHYAVAFVDIRMPPGWDGIETIKHIWEIDPDIQVVICTAYSDYTWEETITQLGLTDNLLILKKPFDTTAVRQFVTALTKKWQLLGETRKQHIILEQTVQERTAALQKNISLMQATMESSDNGILVINHAGEIVDSNQYFRKMWRVPDTIMNNKKAEALFQYLDTQTNDHQYFSRQQVLIKNDAEIAGLDTIYLENGQVFERYFQPQWLDNTIVGRVWSFRDITQRIQLQKQLAYQATHDVLTQLPNRMLLDSYMSHILSAAGRHQHKVALLFIDLDHFKMVNDNFGHAVGDELLKAIADRLTQDTRKENIMTRISGDEFVCVMPKVNNTNEAEQFATIILDKFRKPFILKEVTINITSSIGVSLYPDNGSTFTELLKNADTAMYRAKELGANNFKICMQKMNEKEMSRQNIEMDLRTALLNHEFCLYYQPQFSVAQDHMIGVEALLRWKHPTKGLIFPNDFIGVAESSGLIIPIGKWVIQTVCEQLKRWKEENFLPLRVSINVAMLQLRQSDFVDFLQKTLKENGLKKDDIDIEITENVVTSYPEIFTTIRQLHELGIRVILDDFGTGNSSLNLLRELSPAQLKIDKSFIENIQHDHNSAVIVDAIMAIATSLNLEIVAEGVEQQSQLDYLKAKKCKMFQGYYFSKPLPEDQLTQLLIRRFHDS